MHRIIYLLAYPLLWGISKLPFRIFYLFSDFIFFLIYTIIGYRKKVVLANLQLAFPEKTIAELKTIRRKFYAHMCDIFLETIKTMSISETVFKQRFQVRNIEVFKTLEQQKSVLVLFPHYANWEWSIIINKSFSSKGYAVYQKISNPYFDALIKRIRGKWNTTLITQQETVKTVLTNERNGVSGVYGMISDQSPQVSKAQLWTEFMGVKVPVHNGAEILARKFDLHVIFLRITKKKRGYYEAEAVPITSNAPDTESTEITKQFLRLSEDEIRKAPEFYLWTHKRWKHRHKVPKAFQDKPVATT